MKQTNGRRNSGGTLRQKFNPIDILHLTNDILHFTLNQWTNGPMSQCPNGPLDQWTKRPMDQWTNGPMDQGTEGSMDQWTKTKKLLQPYEKKNTLQHWNN